MKKIFFVLALAAVVFTGCSKKNASAKTVHGWYSDFDAAQETAKNENKSIILYVTAEYDGMPDFLKNNQKLLTDSDEFASSLSDMYVCVHYDFSKSVLENGFDQEKGAYKDELEKKFLVADKYSITNRLPAMVIVSKDGYYIGEVYFDYAGSTVDGYVSKVRLEDNDVKAFNEKIQKIEESSGLEKVKAIKAVYDGTPEMQKVLLGSLYEEIPDLDPKNESGFVNEFLVADANYKAYDFLKKMDIVNAVKVYEAAAENERLDAAGKEYLLCACFRVLTNSNSTDYAAMQKYLEKASAANGPNKKSIDAELVNLKNFVAELKK